VCGNSGPRHGKTFENRSISFKIKAHESRFSGINHPREIGFAFHGAGRNMLNIYEVRPLKNVQFWSRSRKAKISTTGIYRIFRGLKFEPDAEIGQISPDFERGRFAKVSRL